MYIYLLKYTYAQNGEYAVNAGLQAKLPLYNQHERVYSEGTPDLYFDRVGFATKESFDSHVLLSHLKKSSIVQRALYSRAIVSAGKSKLLVRKTRSFPVSGSR